MKLTKFVDFALQTVNIVVVLRNEEELLCKTKSSREGVVLAPPCFLAKARTGVTRVQVPGGCVFALQLTINIFLIPPFEDGTG